MALSLHAINDPGLVWRIGYAPEPWDWTDWAYCDMASAATIAALWPRFLLEATTGHGFADFDAAVLQDSRSRELTQRVGQAVYEMGSDAGGPFDGIRFLSRHGADNELWAVYERSTDGPRSAQLRDIAISMIYPESNDVLEVFGLFHLRLD